MGVECGGAETSKVGCGGVGDEWGRGVMVWKRVGWDVVMCGRVGTGCSSVGTSGSEVWWCADKWRRGVAVWERIRWGEEVWGQVR